MDNTMSLSDKGVTSHAKTAVLWGGVSLGAPCGTVQ